MKISLLTAPFFAACLLVALPAFAEEKRGAVSAPGRTTHTTADYSESQVQGDQVIEFKGDQLPGDLNDPYAGIIHGPPRMIRHGLIRPRMNFVPELLKSVENL